MAPPVLFHVSKHIAEITLNRPERRNAINQELLVHLYDALDKVTHRKNIRVAIITGNGPSFSAGLDFDPVSG